ncbi:uncharacterized protein LOC130120899 isoform X2 [Lampris incognitus]|nr:uncharacterized protein LOC130120899 isoform X2 [Lampris incognitus]
MDARSKIVTMCTADPPERETTQEDTEGWTIKEEGETPEVFTRELKMEPQTEVQTRTEIKQEDSGAENKEEILRGIVEKQQQAIEALKGQIRDQHSTPLTNSPDIVWLTPEVINNSSIPNFFEYCTGFTYCQYNDLCAFLGVPSSAHAPQHDAPLVFTRSTNSSKSMPLRLQLLLVLMKLRNNFDMKDLAFRFQTDCQSVSIIFGSWIDYMYDKLGQVATWPHRDIIASQMPAEYKQEFPTTFANLAFVELKIDEETSLVLQGQSCSDYKSSNKLKGLVACDPHGSVMFASALYSGSVSDKEIFSRCQIISLLENLIKCGHLHKGDGIMVNKCFLIKTEVEELGLKLNIPPIAESNAQMTAVDRRKMKKKMKSRLPVTRAIAKIKKFKIVSNRVLNTRLKNINEIWSVVCMLSNFQSHTI